MKAQIDAHTLQFDPKDAQTAINATSTLLASMRAYQKAVSDFKLDSLPDISFLGSGQALTSGLNRRGIELKTALGTHVDILTAMIDTFREASKAYRYADGVSADQLKAAESNIKWATDFPTPTNAADLDINPKTYRSGAFSQFPELPKDLKNWAKDDHKTKDKYPINWESKDQDWDTLIKLHNTLNGDPYAFAGEDYAQLASKIDSKSKAFVNTIEGLANSWLGAGGKAARDAVNKYANDLQPLVDTMNTMSSLLTWTGSWVAYCKDAMPSKKHDSWYDSWPWGDSDLSSYRKKFGWYYLEPGKDTQSVLPVMPGPQVDAPTPPNPGDKPPAPPGDTPTAPPADKPTAPPGSPAGDKPSAPSGGQPTGSPSGKPKTPGESPQGQNHPQGQNPNDQPKKHDQHDKPKNDKNHPNGQSPNGQKPNGQNPNGQTPNGQSPNSQYPNGQNPNGNPNPNSGYPNTSTPQTTSSGATGGSDTSQLTSALTSLMTGMTSGISTLSQQLPTLLQQLQSATQTTDTAALAHLFGVPEDKVTSAFAAVEKDPAKLAQLGQLLGLTSTADTPMAGIPATEVRSEALPVGTDGQSRATGQAAGTPAFTNLFRTGLGAELATPIGTPEGAMVASAAGAEPVDVPVDFVRTLEHGLDQAFGAPEATAAEQ
ncbi:hypothetical protein [Nocardia yunnanensis]|uniref:hypothetical protein n=1 Tax=Nocardia yunnanensis TaxID=2382165 RepID=UPI0013C46A08|nr:hypothetical protein [Nocardia yunnanensis]